MDALVQLNIDLKGVVQAAGRSARLRIIQHSDGSHSFSSDLGVATTAATDCFPAGYLEAGHVHLGTMPVEEQVQWMSFLRSLPGRRSISVDMFESVATQAPDACRDLCYTANVSFMNESERDILFSNDPLPDRPIVLKRGGCGAVLITGDQRVTVRARRRKPVDTTGAGEVLAGVYLSLQSGGTPREVALRHAVSAASAKVEEFGVDGPVLRSQLVRIKNEIGDSRCHTPCVSQPP